MVESLDVEPRIWRANCKVTHGFLTGQSVSAPNPDIIQGPTVLANFVPIFSLYTLPHFLPCSCL